MTITEKIWKGYVRPKIFLETADNPERAHTWGLAQLQKIQENDLLTYLARRMFTTHHPMLSCQVFGLHFDHPFGLAAGYDKYCQVFHGGVPAMGWASCDVGLISKHMQEGTPSTDPDWPRLRRSEALQALWNKMGGNNPGADCASHYLALPGHPAPIPIGANVAKSQSTPMEDAAEDYAYTVDKLWRFVNYFVLNFSSPNTKGLRSLQALKPLSEIVLAVDRANRRRANQHEGRRKPVVIKLAPDLTDEQLSDIVDWCIASDAVDGIEGFNTTTARTGINGWKIPADAGGVSGPPLRDRALKLMGQMYRRLKVFRQQHYNRAFAFIGTGGIGSGRDAYRRILHGASLVRVFTAWVFEGPDFAKRACRELVGCLKADGFSSVEDAVGAHWD